MSGRSANLRTLKPMPGQRGCVRNLWNPLVERWQSGRDFNHASQSKRGDLVLLVLETDDSHFPWSLWVLFSPKAHAIGKMIDMRAPKDDDEPPRKTGRR